MHEKRNKKSADKPSQIKESMVNTPANFPTLAPLNLNYPWLTAFTTLSKRATTSLDFSAKEGSVQRQTLEHAMEPLVITWLTLEHKAKVVRISNQSRVDTRNKTKTSPVADAAIITEAGTAVAFTTADCLPIICASRKKPLAAGIHAGWRSLAAGVIEAVLWHLAYQFATEPEDLDVWIGPAVAPGDYEVGRDVRDALLTRPTIDENCFTVSHDKLWLADLPLAAIRVFSAAGVSTSAIRCCPLSTATSPFLHSVRRDGNRAGRMATVVGILPSR